MSDLKEQLRAKLDVRHEFEMWKSNRGEACLRQGDSEYRPRGVTAQFAAFIGGFESARRAPAAGPAPVAAIKTWDMRMVEQYGAKWRSQCNTESFMQAEIADLRAALAAALAAAPIVQPVAVGVTYLDMDGCPDIRLDVESLMHVPAGTTIYAGTAPMVQADTGGEHG